MRLQTIQIVAGLAAAIAFFLAFMAAGAALASGLFMLLGIGALAFLAWSLIKAVLSRSSRAGPPAPTA
jgi:hypothetical protein